MARTKNSCMTNRMNWTISYTDFFGKKIVEAFKDKDEAQARYEALVPRTYGDFGDLMSVSAPVRSATKISESVVDDVDLSNQWDDLGALVKGLFLRGFDNPRGKYFYVQSDYSDEMDAVHSVYSRGTDSKVLDVHVVSSTNDDPMVAIVNQGLQGKAFEVACSVIEPVVTDWFNMVDDGYHGILAKIDDSSEYPLWLKDHGLKNEDGASAASLGAVPTGVVGRKGKTDATLKPIQHFEAGDPKFARPNHESKRSEALPPKQWGDRARKFPTRAALVKKAKVLQATEIGSYDEYLKLNKDVCLDKIGFAMDINGNCVARLWWGEDDGKYYYSVKRDVLDRTV